MYKPGTCTHPRTHTHPRTNTHTRTHTHTAPLSGRLVLLDFCYVLQLWRTFSAQVISSLFLSASSSSDMSVCACVCVFCVGVCITIFYQFSKPLDERQFTPAVALETSASKTKLSKAQFALELS